MPVDQICNASSAALPLLRTNPSHGVAFDPGQRTYEIAMADEISLHERRSTARPLHPAWRDWRLLDQPERNFWAFVERGDEDGID